jgi:PIN domain nuclease of toxin-antitoxin system
MKLLLDTHAVLWAMTDTTQLSKTALRAITNPSHQIFASSANAWELSIKHHLGKMPEAAQILPAYHTSLARARFLELLVSSEHGILAGGLNWPHRDPFDRILVAQAQVEQLTLVTMDAIIAQSGLVTVLW